MSTFTKTTDNNYALGKPGATLSIMSDTTFSNSMFTGSILLSGQDKVTSNGLTGKIDQDIGNYNTQYGCNNTLLNCTVGAFNTAIGRVVMEAITNGSNNTACGCQCLPNATSGSWNTCIGQYCGTNIITGQKNTILGSYANVTNDMFTQSTALGYGSHITASNQLMLGTVTETVYIPNAMVTQGLVYEVVTAATQTSTNAPTLSYGAGGVFTLGTSITANATLAVTNIPIDSTKSFTFTVSYQQTSTRFYIATVQLQDTAGAYITNSATAGFVAPLWNGGTPSLSGTTTCVIIQSFTVISVGGSRRVISSLSCCS